MTKTKHSANVTFHATIQPIETAESDLAGFLPALVFRNKRLQVTLQESVD